MQQEEIEFQIYDWNYCDEKDIDDDSDNTSNDINDEDKKVKWGEDLNDSKFIIRVFGKTRWNVPIYMKITDFKPYFYIQVPSYVFRGNIQKSNIHRIYKILYDNLIKMDTIPRNSDEVLEGYEIVEKHLFNEFTDYERYTFLKLIFRNHGGFRLYQSLLRKRLTIPNINKTPIKCTLFETNIEPHLRFMHERNINSCGFVKCSFRNSNTKLTYNNQCINGITKWNNITGITDNAIMPLIIASFDIECVSEDGTFPIADRDNDRIIQIATTFNMYGNSECYYKHIITLDTCEEIVGSDVVQCKTEKEVLKEWTKLIQRLDPDIITGYNIFGFDFPYMDTRAKKLGCYEEFNKLSRLKDYSCKLIKKELVSAAYGKNEMYYYDMIGRIQVDLLKVMQREYKLTSFKLDNVAATFIRENINELKIIEINKNKITEISTKSTFGLSIGRYIKIYYNDGLSDNSYRDDEKFKIVELGTDYIRVLGEISDINYKKYKTYWCQAKDDVAPRELFELQKGTSQDRAKIGEYCIQDCVLCNQLMEKLQILTNNIGMSNVCSVPLSYIFLRGQGIKILSLVSKKCKEKDHILPLIEKKQENIIDDDKEDGYEGATVLYPMIGYHLTNVTTLDYSSLYPSSMIHRNISHECLVKDPRYDNLEKYIYYSIIHYDKEGKEVVCKFAKRKDGITIGILPEILQDLLRARSITRKLAEKEEDKFKAKIYDGLQLAYKVTANSLYGQTGAKTSSIYMKEVAASTTATGREMLNCARLFSERIYPSIIDSIINNRKEEYKEKMDKLLNKRIDELLGETIIKELKNNKYKSTLDPEDKSHLTRASDYFYLRVFQENYDMQLEKRIIDERNNIKTREEFYEWFYKEINIVMKDKTMKPFCVYGDTDSIFVDFGLIDKTINEKIKDKRSVELGIKLGILCGRLINLILPAPQNLAYEKTFWPFILLSKKRYVGNLYEMDPNKFYQKSMGIVLKRRDNAPIVKIVVGGIVDKLLNEYSSEKAVEFTKKSLYNILSGKYGMDKFIISKTLKGSGMTESEIDKENSVSGMNKIILKMISKIETIFKLIKTENREFIGVILASYVDLVGNIETISDDDIHDTQEFILYHIKNLGISITDKEKREYKRMYTEKPKSDIIINILGLLFKSVEKLKICNYVSINEYINKVNKKHQQLVRISSRMRNAHNEQNKKRNIYIEIKGKILQCANDKSQDMVTSLNSYFEQVKKANAINKPYVDRSRIVHAVLADRITFRDPGNKPLSNDRIQYVYVITNKKVDIQGERVEHPEYVIEHKLKLDYLFYITNQIMKPSMQILETMIKEPKKIFDKYIERELNRRMGKKPINYFFPKSNNESNTLNLLDMDNDDTLIIRNTTIPKKKTKKVINIGVLYKQSINKDKKVTKMITITNDKYKYIISEYNGNIHKRYKLTRDIYNKTNEMIRVTNNRYEEIKKIEF